MNHTTTKKKTEANTTIFKYNFLTRRFFSTGTNLCQKPKKLLILSLIFLRK